MTFKPEMYVEYEELIRDIKSIKIQGATNVALATLHGIKLISSKLSDSASQSETTDLVKSYGYELANARDNEPLARNGVKYILYKIGEAGKNLEDGEGNWRELLQELCREYIRGIEDAKKRIIENSKGAFSGIEEVRGIMTHCHSSTAVTVIANYISDNPHVPVVTTETRPLYQGRKTATRLIEKGVDTTMIVDSAAESFITDKGSFPIDILFIGADQITSDGSTINKIGSWG
ncbi:MAG TPA: hypothetical protein ENN64_00010, partial [bacterium]|nr:hypothetical protein [bacterium]